MRCLIQFAQAHDEFRLAELFSVAKLHGINLPLQPDAPDVDVTRPFMIIDLDEEDARLLAWRCILVRSIFELYAHGDSFEVVHEENRANRLMWEHHIERTTFRFQVIAYNHSIPQSRQREVMESFAYMDWKGEIDMKNPEVVLTYIEEYPIKGSKTWRKYEDDGLYLHAYFGRLIADGTARDLIQTFDVKKRSYFGNTSMDAEVSLLMANQALASPSKLIYDPFAGTGSMLYTAAHFGALVFGSDIDGRQMRGKETMPGIIRSAEQYGLKSRIAGLATFDMTQHPWRTGGIFDAIVTDPPYGVRAGAKRLGKKEKPGKEDKPPPMPPPNTNGRVPPTKPYELADLANDLLLYARYLLKPDGRLVFFLPTVNDEYSDVDIPQCEGMSLVSNSLQDFGSWGRRLITMEKTSTEEYPAPIFLGRKLSQDDHQPAHQGFREKYFTGFKKPGGEDNADDKL